MFTPCILPVSGTPDDFTAPDSMGKVFLAVSKVIEQEAPVSKTALMKKVMAAWGISRKSKPVLSVFDRAFATTPHKETEAGEMLWRADQIPEEYSQFRAGSGDTRRRIEDICLEEICAAIAYVLNAQISLPQSDLILAVAKIFGYARISAVEERVLQGIALAENKGLAVSKDGMISIVS